MRWTLVRQVCIGRLSQMIGLISILGSISASFPASAAAPVIIGVNQVNLGWSTDAQRRQTLADMAKSGVHSVRLVLTPPFNESITAIKEAEASRLSVLLNVNVNFPQFYPPQVAGQTVHDGKDWPLSRFDPKLFMAMFKPIWDQLETEHIPLIAIEFGNEINWAGFNADLAAGDTSGRGTSGQLATLPERQAFVKGLQNYVEGLRVLAALRSSSTVNRNMKIISAGLATVPPDDAKRMGLHYVGPEDTLKVLQSSGADQLLDGYGVHFYPSPKPVPAGHWEAEKAAMTVCHSDAHPCWVTEWGVAAAANDCLSAGPERRSAMAGTMASLRQLAATRKIRRYIISTGMMTNNPTQSGDAES